jgi:hypothetical protein
VLFYFVLYAHHTSFSLTVCLFCLSLSISFSVTLFPSLCLNIMTVHSPSMPPSVSLPLPLSLPISLSIFSALSPLPLCITTSLPSLFFVFTSNVLPPSIDLSLSLFSLPFPLPYSVSLSHSYCIPLSSSLSICIPISVLSSLSCLCLYLFLFLLTPQSISRTFSPPFYMSPLSCFIQKV